MAGYRRPSEPIAFVLPDIVPGIITVWHGTIGTVPTGWHLCDGAAGTPDLRNRFVLCVFDSGDVGYRSGGDSHMHVVTIAAHDHWLPKVGPVGFAPTPVYDKFVDSQGDSGESSTVLNRPPYYAHAYIMRL